MYIALFATRFLSVVSVTVSDSDFFSPSPSSFCYYYYFMIAYLRRRLAPLELLIFASKDLTWPTLQRRCLNVWSVILLELPA